MPHPSYCTFHACQRTVCACPDLSSDEALAALRKKLAGEPEWAPLDVTVYTAHGEVTVRDVRDDSIERRPNGDLFMEQADGSYRCRTYTFFGVIGWSSVPHEG